MKTIVIFVFLTTTKLIAQTSLKPLISVGYFQTYTNYFALNELQLGAGIQFNDYISTQVNLRGSLQRVLNGPSENFKIATISIEPSYRILGKKHMFSPVIAYDAGVEIANNGKNKFISDYVYYPNYQESYRKYNKGLYFGKAKILLSFEWKGFDLLLGATYNTYFFSLYNLTAYGASEDNSKIVGTFTDGQFGFGFETSLKYTFPMKKRAAKKALEQSKAIE